MWGKRKGVWEKSAFCWEKIKNAEEKNIHSHGTLGRTRWKRTRHGAMEGGIDWGGLVEKGKGHCPGSAAL